ncbi:hypothetical protein GCM10009603_23880 [Nocardiopsis exhalans]
MLLSVLIAVAGALTLAHGSALQERDAVRAPGRQLGRASREIALEHDHHRSLERFEAVYTRVRGRGTVRPAVERVMVA